MTNRNSEKVLEIYSILKTIYGNSNYDHTYRYLTDDLLGNWEKEYYGPIPSFLVGGLKNLSCLKEVDEILIKDGAMGVLRFFRTFSSPPKWLETQFFIKKSLAGLVPKEWNSNVKVFEDYFLDTHKERESLVVHGVLAKGVCCFENFSNQLDQALKCKSLKNIHVIVRTPVKMEGYFDEDETYGLNEFLNILTSKTNGKIETTFYKLDDIEKIDFSKSLYLSIDNSDILHSGLSSEISMYSRGAVPVGYSETSSSHEKVLFSECHGISVVDYDLGDKLVLLEKIETEYADSVNSYTDLDLANLLLT